MRVCVERAGEGVCEIGFVIIQVEGHLALIGVCRWPFLIAAAAAMFAVGKQLLHPHFPHPYHQPSPLSSPAPLLAMSQSPCTLANTSLITGPSIAPARSREHREQEERDWCIGAIVSHSPLFLHLFSFI